MDSEETSPGIATGEAREALRACGGLFVGAASGLGHNCLIDSLLQLLCVGGVLPGELAFDASMRADIAGTVRQRLVHAPSGS